MSYKVQIRELRVQIQKLWDRLINENSSEQP